MPPWQKILQKKLSGQKLDQNKLRGKNSMARKLSKKWQQKFGNEQDFLTKDIGQNINFVACRPRWVAAASGEVKLAAKEVYD